MSIAGALSKSMARSRGRGEPYAIGASVLWGTNVPAIGLALRDISPWSISATRGLLQLAVIAVILAASRQGRAAMHFGASIRDPKASIRKRTIALALLAATGGGFSLGLTVSVELAGSVPAAFITGLYPIAAVLFAPALLGEPLRRSSVVSLALASGGVALLLDPGSASDPPHVVGIAVAVASAISYGMYVVLARRFVRELRLMTMAPSLALASGSALLSVAAGLSIGGLDTASLVPPMSPLSLAALLWIAVPAGVVPLLLSEVAYRRLPTARNSPYMFIGPIIATALSIPMLGVSLAPIQLAGGTVAVIGIAMATKAPAAQGHSFQS